jgi:uncharacterized membrane protein
VWQVIIIHNEMSCSKKVVMKKIVITVLVCALGSFCFLQAQDIPTPPVVDPIDGVENPPPVEVPEPEQPEPEIPEMPDIEVPEFDGIPEDVAALLDDLHATREVFVAAQREIAETVQEQREAIRDSIQEQLEDWRAAQQALRQDILDRVAEMRAELQTNLPAQAGGFEGGRP